VIGLLDWLVEQPSTAKHPVGLFGASTGAAAALVAAAERPAAVRAVVSRGGRPDLAVDSLPQVAAPTLLVVGGNDTAVLQANRQVLPKLSSASRLEVVPGATHLFEEPGTLEHVAEESNAWFQQYIGRPPATPNPR
ncbi:MAG: hydrolase, partial [Chloroflexi bacterium]|nr:hydrolase [Chloroflexota bacterium]